MCCPLFTVKKLYSKITETVKKDLAYEAELEAKNTGLSRHMKAMWAVLFTLVLFLGLSVAATGGVTFALLEATKELKPTKVDVTGVANDRTVLSTPDGIPIATAPPPTQLVDISPNLPIEALKEMKVRFTSVEHPSLGEGVAPSVPLLTPALSPSPLCRPQSFNLTIPTSHGRALLNIEVLGFIRNVCEEGDAACDPANDTLTLMTPKCDILVYKAGPIATSPSRSTTPPARSRRPSRRCPIRGPPRGACSASTRWCTGAICPSGRRASSSPACAPRL